MFIFRRGWCIIKIMLKGFTGIAAFVLTFGLSVSLVGLLFGFTGPGLSVKEAGDHQVSDQITNFLSRDVANGRFRNRTFQRHLSEGYSREYNSYVAFEESAVRDYVDASSSMDDSVLPADLRYAWREHMDAWKTHLSVLGKGSIESRSMPGCCDEAFSIRYRTTSRKINSTWYQVLRIAERYGADTRGMR